VYLTTISCEKAYSHTFFRFDQIFLPRYYQIDNMEVDQSIIGQESNQIEKEESLDASEQDDNDNNSSL